VFQITSFWVTCTSMLRFKTNDGVHVPGFFLFIVGWLTCSVLARIGSKQMVEQEASLPGRTAPIENEWLPHAVLNSDLHELPLNHEIAIFAMGCFWGAEKKYWELNGVYSTAVGYINGFTPNPTYEEVCTGQTGHTEAVKVVFDPDTISYVELLRVFWENHDPTQYMAQDPDVGTQYRSGIYFTSAAQKDIASKSLNTYQRKLTEHGYGKIESEIESARTFYFAENYHQQYKAKNPEGQCAEGLGITCPTNDLIPVEEFWRSKQKDEL